MIRGQGRAQSLGQFLAAEADDQHVNRHAAPRRTAQRCSDANSCDIIGEYIGLEVYLPFRLIDRRFQGREILISAFQQLHKIAADVFDAHGNSRRADNAA
jgi:hypothetical protein